MVIMMKTLLETLLHFLFKSVQLYHIETPVLVWTQKLSNIGPGQHLDGWPQGNLRCCNHGMDAKRVKFRILNSEGRIPFQVSYIRLFSELWLKKQDISEFNLTKNSSELSITSKMFLKKHR